VLDLGKSYRYKAAAVKETIRALGTTPEAVLGRYGETIFQGARIRKRDAFVEVLNGELSAPVAAYFEEKCGALFHFRDRRSGPQYAADLALGWLVEDAVLKRLADIGDDTVLSGEDRFREFLPPAKISTQADIRITTARGPRLVEVFTDYTGHWRKTGQMDLRDRKYQRLVREEALLFCIAPLTAEGFVIDFGSEDGGFAPTVNPLYGGKPVNQSPQARDRLQALGDAIGRIYEVIRGDGA
jgi:hypothetical protein